MDDTLYYIVEKCRDLSAKDLSSAVLSAGDNCDVATLAARMRATATRAAEACSNAYATALAALERGDTEAASEFLREASYIERQYCGRAAGDVAQSALAYAGCGGEP